MSAPPFGRRTYVLDRGFQLKYTLILVGAGSLVSLLFGGMMYLTHVNAVRELDLPEAARAALSRSDSALFALMATASILMAAALGLFGILITHRVAGPIYVMSHYISILSRGRYPIMRPLRRSDELRQFFQGFQEALETMRSKEADEAKRLEEAIVKLQAGSTSSESTAALEELRAMAQRKRDATELNPAPPPAPVEQPAA